MDKRASYDDVSDFINSVATMTDDNIGYTTLIVNIIMITIMVLYMIELKILKYVIVNKLYNYFCITIDG